LNIYLKTDNKNNQLRTIRSIRAVQAQIKLKRRNKMHKKITNINGRELKNKMIVTSLGEVVVNGKVQHQSMRGGYKTVNLTFVDGYSKIYVHQLVMYVFQDVLTTRENGLVIHHIDGDKTHNNLDNLMVVTRGQNVKYYQHVEAQEKNETQYNMSNVEKKIVPLKRKGVEVKDYAIDIWGEVMKFNHKRDMWEVLPMYQAGKVPSNVVVNINGRGVSLGQLMAENFFITEPERKFRVHQLDTGEGFQNDFYVSNLRIAYVGA